MVTYRGSGEGGGSSNMPDDSWYGVLYIGLRCFPIAELRSARGKGVITTGLKVRTTDHGPDRWSA